jgi:ribosomal protein L7/L12
VDNTPSVLKEAVPIEEAKKIQDKIKAAGGECALE